MPPTNWRDEALALLHVLECHVSKYEDLVSEYQSLASHYLEFAKVLNGMGYTCDPKSELFASKCQGWQNAITQMRSECEQKRMNIHDEGCDELFNGSDDHD